MDNHFHLVVRIPSPEEPVPEEEVLRRYAVLVGKEKAGELESRLAHMRERGDSHSVDIILDRMRSRMYDLSQFGKTFKETFGRIFRRRRPWCGNLWEGRFKSTLIGEAEYLRICTAYVELNPVRAGLSTSSSGYEWCTTGAAERGNAFAQRCRERLAAVAGFGDSPRSEGWLMKRAPQISCGKIFGNSEFVAESLGLLADRVEGIRKKLVPVPRPNQQAGTDPVRPLKNGLPQPPLLFPAEYAIISAFPGVDRRSAGRV
jgi:hypothetical protein